MAGRMRMSADQLSQMLESQHIRPDTLKQRIKAEMVWTALVRGRFKESLQVGEKEVNAAAGTPGEVKDEKDDKDKTDAESFEYKMQPIVLIVPKGSSPAAIELRRKEAETLRGRIQTCDEANGTVQEHAKRRDTRCRGQNLGRHAGRAACGARQDADRPSDRAGTDQAGRGKWLRSAAESRPQSIPPRKKEIRDKMFNDKFEAKSNAYLQQIRKAAMIEYRH